MDGIEKQIKAMKGRLDGLEKKMRDMNGKMESVHG